MDLIEVIGVGIVLSADSFTAALAIGFRRHKPKDILTLAISSGAVEALMTLIGAFAGEKIISRFSEIDHWIAFFLLLIVAVHMGYQSLSEFRNNKTEDLQFQGLFALLIVSFATSLDGLAVGVSLGVSEKSISPFIISIGFCAFISTILGMALAKKVPTQLRPLFTLLGALILAILAIQMLEL